jgi:hypothetical protein
MKKIQILLAVAVLLLASGAALAQSGEGSGNRFEVTITNLTYDQIISPPVAVLHDDRFQLFRSGMPASPELAALAEDGMTGPLAGLVQVSDGVEDYDVAGGGLMPGASVTLELQGPGHAGLVSLAGMLISTNDAFVGISGQAAPRDRSARVMDAPAYDSGSEANTESCAHIPGPPCGNGGVRVTEGAEGFVHIHRGIRGDAELDAGAKDWRNPAARITVRRVVD